jgi:hypothetical protein
MRSGGWGAAEGCSRDRGGGAMGTLLSGCEAPPVQQSTRRSCRVCGVRSRNVQLAPSSERTAADMTRGRSVLWSRTPSLPPVLPCDREAAWLSGGASSRLQVSNCASSSPSTSAIVGCPTVGTTATARPAADAAHEIGVSKGPHRHQRDVWRTVSLPAACATLHDHITPWRGCASSSCDAEAAR